MKVTYLLGSLNRGGAETLLLDVFRNARMNRLDATGIYRKSGVCEDDFLKSGVSMYNLTTGRNFIMYLIRLRKFLKKNKTEKIHAQQPIDALYGYIATIGTDIKVILTLHGYDFYEKELAKRMLNFIIRRTDTNIYVSDNQREYYQTKFKLNPLKQKVVYNGVSFDKFDKEKLITVNNIRNELNLSPKTIILGSVGNFVSVRDQFTICRFLKNLNDNKIDFHFLFIGKRDKIMPQLYDNCVNYCQQNNLINKVSFMGSRDDVPELLGQLDAFVYSSDHDTFGIAVVEAMAVGLPVFVNDWEVMTEITDSGKYATLFKTKDENDLLLQFMLFLQNKETYKAKALEASRFVREKYSIEKHIENLKEVYNSLY